MKGQPRGCPFFCFILSEAKDLRWRSYAVSGSRTPCNDIAAALQILRFAQDKLSRLSEGAAVEFEVVQGPKGLQASNVTLA